MNNYLMVGVGTINLFDPSTGALIVTSKTLTDSGINLGVTAEDIRGGMGAKLLGQYFHSSIMGLTLTDATFAMDYIALNVGGEISVGGDFMTTEQVTVTTANQITVSSDPEPFAKLGVIGWYEVAGNGEWTKIDFDGRDANVPELAVGTTICVKYITNSETLRKFTVSSTFIPSKCYALLTLPLFDAGADQVKFTAASKVGEVQVEIPNFLLSGAQDLTLNMNGATTVSLSGNAVATFTGEEGCDGDGYYAILKEIIYYKDEFLDMASIVVVNSNMSLSLGNTKMIEVRAIYNGMTKPKKINNEKLTFVSKTPSIATVNNSGLITAVSAGETTIEVSVTDAPHLSSIAMVTIV